MHAYFRGIDSWEYNEDECFLDIHKAYRITVGLVVESLISDPCVQVAMKAWEEKYRGKEGNMLLQHQQSTNCYGTMPMLPEQKAAYNSTEKTEDSELWKRNWVEESWENWKECAWYTEDRMNTSLYFFWWNNKINGMNSWCKALHLKYTETCAENSLGKGNILLHV